MKRRLRCLIGLILVFLCATVTVGSRQLHGQTVVATIDVEVRPQDVVVNPNTNRVYVANEGSDNVSVREEQEWEKTGKSLDEFPKERILSVVMFELENKLLHCGDSWYGWGGGSGNFSGTQRLLELKDISVEVIPYELSKADRANGIKWKGRIPIKSDLYRELVGKEWGKWRDGSDGVPIFKVGRIYWMTMAESGVNLEIENGEWHWSKYFSNAKKPNYTCKNIPK